MISRKTRKAFTLGFEALLKTYKIDLSPCIYEGFMDDFEFRVKTRGPKEAVAFYKAIKLFMDSVVRNDQMNIETDAWVSTQNGVPKKFLALVNLLKSKKLSTRQKQVIISLFDYPALFVGKCSEYDTSTITDPEPRSEAETYLVKQELEHFGLDLNKTLWGSDRDIQYVKSKEPPVRITNKSCYNGKLPLKGNGLKDIAAFMNKNMLMKDSSGNEVQTRALAIKIAKLVYNNDTITVEFPYIMNGYKIVKKVTAYKAFLYLCATSIRWCKKNSKKRLDKHAYRTHFIPEEFGKERCAIVPNYLINILFKPLDEHYMSILRLLKEDGTFNQDEAFDFVCSRSSNEKFNGSVDQSSWTDKLDINLLAVTDKGIIQCELSELVNQIFRLPVKKTDQNGNLQTIYYARGAGMGTYFVWSRSSVFHHKMVQLCNYKALLGIHPLRLPSFKPLRKFRDYRIVGDDNTLLSKEILRIYLRTCESIGLKVSRNKTIVTEGKYTSGVFCKRSYLNGKEVSTLTSKMIANAYLSLNNFVDLLRMLNQRKMLTELSDYELSDGLKGLVKPKWLGYLQSPYNEFGKPFLTFHPKGNLWEKVDENNFHIYYRHQLHKEIVERIKGFQVVYKEWGLGGIEYQSYPEGRPLGEMVVDREPIEDRQPMVETYPLLLFAYQKFIDDFIMDYEEATSDYGLHTPASIEEHVLLRIHGQYHDHKDDKDGQFFAEFELDKLSKQPNPLKYGEKKPFHLKENGRQSVLLKALKGYLEDPTLVKQTDVDETGSLEHYSKYCSNYLDLLNEDRPKWPYSPANKDEGAVVATPNEDKV